MLKGSEGVLSFRLPRSMSSRSRAPLFTTWNSSWVAVKWGQGVGVLGRNVLQIADAEYDFADGVARLMKAKDCSDALLAYWLRPGESYSVIRFAKAEETLETGSHIVTKKGFRPPVIAVAYVNGAAVRAMFDTRASFSSLVKAAARAGIELDSPGVAPGGSSIGAGRNTVQTYIAPVAVFKIGDEEVHNTRLRLAEMDLPGVDMLIGADFFLSHHIYVANSQDKLYFSYNGGPVSILRLSARLDLRRALLPLSRMPPNMLAGVRHSGRGRSLTKPCRRSIVPVSCLRTTPTISINAPSFTCN